MSLPRAPRSASVLRVGFLLAAVGACREPSDGGRLPLPTFDAGGDPPGGGAAGAPDAAPFDAPDLGPPGPLPASVSIATYNLQNLFDLVDDPESDEGEFTPGPGWDASRLTSRLLRLSQAVAAIQADIVMVEEVENVEVLTQLRDAIRRAGGPEYPEVRSSGSRDPRGIELGVLSRFPLRLAAPRPISREHRCMGEEGIVTLDGGWSEARPIFQVEVDLNRDGETDLVLLGNHWKAKTDSFPCEGDEHRLRSGLALREAVGTLAADTALPIVALGDFNTFEDEPALVEGAGARLAWAEVDGPDGLYNAWGDRGIGQGGGPPDTSANSTYYFRGRWGRLDHLLLSRSLGPEGAAPYTLVGGSVGTVNAAFLLTRDGLPAESGGGAEGYSDHLPVRMTLRLR